METGTQLQNGLRSRKRLLAATIGSGALAVMALFGVAHTLPTASLQRRHRGLRCRDEVPAVLVAGSQRDEHGCHDHHSAVGRADSLGHVEGGARHQGGLSRAAIRR